VSFAAITFCFASQVFIVVYFLIGSVRKLLDTSKIPDSLQFTHFQFTKSSLQFITVTEYIICV